MELAMNESWTDTVKSLLKIDKINVWFSHSIIYSCFWNLMLASLSTIQMVTINIKKCFSHAMLPSVGNLNKLSFAESKYVIHALEGQCRGRVYIATLL